MLNEGLALALRATEDTIRVSGFSFTRHYVLEGRIGVICPTVMEITASPGMFKYALASIKASPRGRMRTSLFLHEWSSDDTREIIGFLAGGRVQPIEMVTHMLQTMIENADKAERKKREDLRVRTKGIYFNPELKRVARGVESKLTGAMVVPTLHGELVPLSDTVATRNYLEVLMGLPDWSTQSIPATR